MAENTENSTPPAGPQSIADKALENALSGISSYTHGSRSVSRISPDTLLDVDARIRARAARRRGGLFVTLDQSGRGVARGSGSPSPSPSGDYATKEELHAVEGRVAVIEGDYVTREDVPPAAVAAVEAADFSSLSLNGERITQWPEGGGAETARIVTADTATVEDGDALILMDTVTAGQAQTLTLPATMEADAQTVTVRQLGDYGVTITGPTDDYELTYAGDWVTLDWVAGKGWFWRA